MPFKELLTALHDAGKFILHIVLIPVLAALKAVNMGLQHLIDELGKV